MTFMDMIVFGMAATADCIGLLCAIIVIAGQPAPSEQAKPDEPGEQTVPLIRSHGRPSAWRIGPNGVERRRWDL